MPVKNWKAKGTRNEHHPIALHETAGCACIRAAASLGTGGILAIGFTEALLLQVNTRNWPGAPEMEVLQNFRVPFDCRNLIHRWGDRQRMPDAREVTHA